MNTFKQRDWRELRQCGIDREKMSENQVKLKFKQTSFLTQRIPSLFLDAFIEEHVLRIPSND